MLLDLLVLDGPTTGLDPAATGDVLQARVGHGRPRRRSAGRSPKENGAAVSFDVPVTSATWTGTFDGDALKGTWSQGGNSLPPTFARAVP